MKIFGKTIVYQRNAHGITSSKVYYEKWMYLEDWEKYEHVTPGQDCDADFKLFKIEDNRPIVAIRHGYTSNKKILRKETELNISKLSKLLRPIILTKVDKTK